MDRQLHFLEIEGMNSCVSRLVGCGERRTYQIWSEIYMAGNSDGVDLVNARENDGIFVWDDASNLYFHSGSGFYHDPNAGWYYSTRDGLYYTYEGGTYVPLTFDKGKESESQDCTSLISNGHVEDNQCNEEIINNDRLESHRRPSEWLEETLINMYLSGTSNLESGAESLATIHIDEEEERSKVPSDELADQVEQLQEEWMNECIQNAELSSELTSRNDLSVEEENWQAQYGQVVKVIDEDIPNLSAVDLWDWKVVVETVKNKQATRLSGRPVRRSSKLHPSVCTGGGILKTAPIRDVHFDLVRVASGKLYRLRTPNSKYLASLTSFDSSNPTKDWGFPDLFLNKNDTNSAISNETRVANDTYTLACGKDVATASQKGYNTTYRDRAAERINLHGQYSIGPGQKCHFASNLHEEELSTIDTQEAAAEAMDMSFGKGSYARKLLEKMGWKDGEALGSSRKGILQPLETVANKGNAGLGWKTTRRGS